LQEFIESDKHTDNHSTSALHDIEQGELASQQICNYVDSLVSTCNPIQQENQTWTKPLIHPCRKKHELIPDGNRDNDYADLVNTVQRHSRCSTKYCLRPSKQEPKELQCRFKYPIDCCNKTTLEFEPIHTKDKSVQYKAKVITKRNDSRLNNHQPIQLKGWRANCDIRVVIDHHACVEYLSKYVAKGEPKSPMLKETFNAVMKNVGSNVHPSKVMKKLMMKSLGERDISAQETMHLLLSLKLYATTFKVLPINLNGSRKIDTSLKMKMYVQKIR
jgi:hypothetical protein